MLHSLLPARPRHSTASDGRLAGTRARWAAIGAAVAVTLGATGIGGYNLVAADVGSGDRTVLVTIDACRLTDTRPDFNVGPRTTPLRSEETHTFDAGQIGVPCSGRIPSEANALLVNVTAVGATVETFLTFWADGPLPYGSSLNPAPGQPPTPNAVTIPLSSDNTFEAYNNAGAVDILIDVVGYYEHHHHDDRYFTKAQANAATQELVEAGTSDFLTATQVRAAAQELVDAGTSDFLTAAQVGDVAQERINAQPPDDTVLRADPADFVRVQDATSWTFGGAAFHTTATSEPECIAAPIRAEAGTVVTSISIRYTSVTGTTNGSVSLTGLRSTPGPIDFGGEGVSSLVNNANVEFFSDSSGVMRNVEVAPTGTPTFVADHVMTLQICTAAPALAIVTALVNTA